jgi:hypothetical protein
MKSVLSVGCAGDGGVERELGEGSKSRLCIYINATVSAT